MISKLLVFPPATPVDISIKIKPISVTDKLIEIHIVAKKTID